MVSQQLQQQLQQSKYDSQSKFYVAGNAFYCSLEDTACQTCTRQWLDTAARGRFVSSASLCVGVDGCLCLASCELPTWKVNAHTALCVNSINGKSTTSAKDYDKISSEDPSTQQMLIAGGACFALLVAFALISLGLSRLVHKIDDNAQQARLNRLRPPVRVPTGPQLQLEGWTSMRARLVEEDNAGPAPGHIPSLAPIAVAPIAPGRDVEEGDEQTSRLWIRW